MNDIDDGRSTLYNQPEVFPEPMSALVFPGILGETAIYRRKKAISESD
jgi:hypothetical protein